MTTRKTAAGTDPLSDPALRGPGLWRMLQELAGRKRRLLDVAQIEVSSHCQGRCAYCPHTTMRGQWKARHMREETFAKLWPLLLETRRIHLQGWGEPLLHPRFIDLVKAARKADCLVSTTSCGLGMNVELATSLVDCGLDIIAFSLTGTREESNNAARRGVEFGRVLESVRLLQKVRKERMGVHLEVHFAYLMLASRMHEVRELPERMQELGVHAAVVSTLDYLPSPEWKEEAFAPDEDDKNRRARDILEEAAERAAGMGLALHYSLPQPQALPDCLEHPQSCVYVDAEGDLSPCIYVNVPTTAEQEQRRVFGSCHEENPLAIWEKEDFKAFRAALAACEPDVPCRSCPKRFALGNRHKPVRACEGGDGAL